MLNLLAVSDTARVTMQIVALTIGSLGFINTVVGLILLWVKLYRQTRCGNRKRKKLEKKLLEQIRYLSPTCILAPDRNGLLIAEEIVKTAQQRIPVVPVTLNSRDLVRAATPTMLRTSKFLIDVPHITFTAAERILIIDDVVITGETIKAIKDELLRRGVKAEIFTAALVVDTTCYKSKCIPDKFAWRSDIRNYRFKWRI